MKRYFYSVVATVLLLGISVSPVSALTFEEMQIQVKTLMARIATLTAQMDALKSQEGGAGTMSATSVGTVSSPRHPHRVCALLSRNLNQGSQGDDVRGVQEFLFEQNYLTSSPTGYFGSLTAQAVKKWQANEGITAAGSFGPLSRERMKIWCGGSSGNAERFSGFPTRGEAPLTVVFDSWLSGFRPLSIYYVIDFGDGTSERAADCSAPADACVSPGQNKHTYADRGNYTATLSKVTNPCAGVEVLCKAAIRSEIVATQNITVGPIACTKEYKPVCGAKQVVCIKAPCNPIQQTYGNRCMMEADGAGLSYEGECRPVTDDPANDPRCKAWYDGCNSCSREASNGPAMCTLRACVTAGPAYCTAYFGSSNDGVPTISGLTGPTKLAVNQVGTWSLNASDPENGQLSYWIQWGDEASVYPYAATLSAELSYVQGTSFTHAYTRAGTYTVTVTVRDTGGNSAKATATVIVGSGEVACTEEYAPVCGRLPGCMNTCPQGMYCAMMCQMHPLATYSNRCHMNAAGADFVYDGVCPVGTL